MNLQIPISQMKEEGNWPLPWVSAIGLIPEIAKLGDNIVGCELGVSYGFNLVHFLENLPNISKVYAIDPYMPYDDGPGGYITQEVIDTVKRLVQINVEEYKEKVKFIFLPADDAHQDIQNESLDYIFIDGDHSFDAVRKDMKHYFSKVRAGGIFAGHDINLPEVQKAVEQFRKENNISAELKTCANCVWYWYKG